MGRRADAGGVPELGRAGLPSRFRGEASAIKPVPGSRGGGDGRGSSRAKRGTSEGWHRGARRGKSGGRGAGAGARSGDGAGLRGLGRRPVPPDVPCGGAQTAERAGAEELGAQALPRDHPGAGRAGAGVRPPSAASGPQPLELGDFPLKAGRGGGGAFLASPCAPGSPLGSQCKETTWVGVLGGNGEFILFFFRW